jgi:hypothetical protein
MELGGSRWQVEGNEISFVHRRSLNGRCRLDGGTMPHVRASGYVRQTVSTDEVIE